MTTPRYFRVERSQHAYLTFIVESYEGICTVSTVDNAKGIIRVLPSEGQEQDLEGLLAALREEIRMEEIVDY
ncbi:MAG: DUF4911 domain-containing protein [Trichlorobacter sp.]|uniref:DUF4911 domain-containing protein n=1 Tax=Trichlorobacter sp. TaxID=2911007 RepID=UPI00256B5053|nr:DUF4911 domain-containing protein [Trichlorobacter sp.]MDK9718597.1 DUF4911 domain-containing protein [Trichlorobacter sp.]